MSPPPKNPSAPGVHVLATDASTCPLGHRCHVEGKGIVKFGTRFKTSQVKHAADHAVVLANADGSRIASGTLIDVGQGGSTGDGFLLTAGEPILAGVVLCAYHSLQTLSASVSVFLPYRLKAPKAPGSSWELVGDAAKWVPSAPDGTYIRGRMTKVLEQGDAAVDYALVYVEFGCLFVPARRSRPLGRTLSDELLLVAHPWHTTYDCEPTQASAGEKLIERAKFLPEHATDYYAYARLSAKDGSSGGGVYNTSMELVGVLKGASPQISSGTAFLNLGAVVNAKVKGTDLLQTFMAGGRYLVG